MICVSNSSPLIFLAKVEHAPLLSVCFEQVFVPHSVVQEVGFSLLPDISNLAVKDLDEAGQSFVADELGRLHRGELEALWLSKTLNADVVLLDDRRARQKAKTLGLKPLGTLGVLVYAHKLGSLSLIEAKRAVAKLQTDANMYLSSYVVQQIDEQLERQEQG